MSTAIGWGFGFTQLMLMHVAPLFHATGPGFLGAPACPTINVFYISALITLGFSLLHICWSLLSFDAMLRKSFFHFAFVIFTHLAASLMVRLFSLKKSLIFFLCVDCRI